MGGVTAFAVDRPDQVKAAISATAEAMLSLSWQKKLQHFFLKYHFPLNYQAARIDTFQDARDLAKFGDAQKCGSAVLDFLRSDGLTRWLMADPSESLDGIYAVLLLARRSSSAGLWTEAMKALSRAMAVCEHSERLVVNEASEFSADFQIAVAQASWKDLDMLRSAQLLPSTYSGSQGDLKTYALMISLGALLFISQLQ